MHIGKKLGTERPRIFLRYKSIPVLGLMFLVPVMSMPCPISQPPPRQPHSFAPKTHG